MSRRQRRVLARVAGVVGVASQILVGLMGIVLFPAAMVSFVAGIAGVRLVARNREAASMRLGVALLASLVGLAFGLTSGALPMATTAIVSTGSFAVAWWLVQQLDREDRAAFGIKHRDWQRRQTQLHTRRDELIDRAVASRDGVTHPESGHDEPGTSTTPGAADDGEWWEQLE